MVNVLTATLGWVSLENAASIDPAFLCTRRPLWLRASVFILNLYSKQRENSRLVRLRFI